jgi:hypothetical protein
LNQQCESRRTGREGGRGGSGGGGRVGWDEVSLEGERRVQQRSRVAQLEWSGDPLEGTSISRGGMAAGSGSGPGRKIALRALRALRDHPRPSHITASDHDCNIIQQPCRALLWVDVM